MANSNNNLLLDYLDLLKTNMDAYASIVDKMSEFEEKHEQEYSQISDILSSPEKLEEITEKMKEFGPEIFFDLMKLMFKASSLDSKVRKVFVLSIDEKRTLAGELRTIYKDMEKFFKKMEKKAKEMEAKK